MLHGVVSKERKVVDMLDEAMAFEIQSIWDFHQLCSMSDLSSPLLTVQAFSGNSARFRWAVAAIPAATTRSECTNLSLTRVASRRARVGVNVCLVT